MELFGRDSALAVQSTGGQFRAGMERTDGNRRWQVQRKARLALGQLKRIQPIRISLHTRLPSIIHLNRRTLHPARYPHVVRKRLLRTNTRVDGVRERIERINARGDSIIACKCRFGREGPKIDLHERGAVGGLDERVCDEFRETLTVIDGAAGVVGFEAEDVRIGSICGEWVPIRF